MIGYQGYMNITTTSFDVPTPERDAMIDITRQVQIAIDQSGVTDGTVTIYVPHTSGRN